MTSTFAQAFRQLFADRALASSHGADQKNVLGNTHLELCHLSLGQMITHLCCESSTLLLKFCVQITKKARGGRTNRG